MYLLFSVYYSENTVDGSFSLSLSSKCALNMDELDVSVCGSQVVNDDVDGAPSAQAHFTHGNGQNCYSAIC